MQYAFTLADVDLIAVYSYDVTEKGCAAQTYGPPENCYPAEGMEFDVTVESLHRDEPGYLGPPLELPEWLKATLEQTMLESDVVYNDIEAEESSQ